MLASMGSLTPTDLNEFAAQESLRRQNMSARAMGFNAGDFITTYGSTTTTSVSGENSLEEKKLKEYKKLPLTAKRINSRFKVILESLEKKEKKKLKKLDKSITIKSQEIANIKKDITRKEQQFEKLKNQLATKKQISIIHEEFQLIKTHPKIDEVYSYGGDIVFETKELFVKNFYMDYNSMFKRKTKKPRLLGRFIIRLKLTKEHIKIAVCNKDFKSDNYDLPTVQDNQCCWGNIAKDIQNDLKELKILEFVDDMISYLESPSNKAAYIRWKRYFADQKQRELKTIPEATQVIVTLGSRERMFVSSDLSTMYFNGFNQGTTMMPGTSSTDSGSTGYQQQYMRVGELIAILGSSLERDFSSDRIIRDLIRGLSAEGWVFVGMFLNSYLREGADRPEIQMSGRRARRGFDLIFMLRLRYRERMMYYASSPLGTREDRVEELRLFIPDSMVVDSSLLTHIIGGR